MSIAWTSPLLTEFNLPDLIGESSAEPVIVQGLWNLYGEPVTVSSWKAVSVRMNDVMSTATYFFQATVAVEQRPRRFTANNRWK